MTARCQRYPEGVKRAGRPQGMSQLARQANADAERMRKEREANDSRPAPVVIKGQA